MLASHVQLYMYGFSNFACIYVINTYHGHLLHSLDIFTWNYHETCGKVCNNYVAKTLSQVHIYNEHGLGSPTFNLPLVHGDYIKVVNHQLVSTVQSVEVRHK